MNDGQALRTFLCEELYPLLCQEFQEYATFDLINLSGPEIQFKKPNDSIALRVRLETENIRIVASVEIESFAFQSGRGFVERDIQTVFYEDPNMESNLLTVLRRVLIKEPQPCQQ